MEYKQALKESIHVWTWLVNNPGMSKNDYPGYHGYLEKYTSNCPLCEFFRNDLNRDDYDQCQYCVLKNTKRGLQLCVNEYYVWMTSIQIGDITTAKEKAKIILDKIQKEYKRVVTNEKKLCKHLFVLCMRGLNFYKLESWSFLWQKKN
jgi:hypothetical protein